MDKERERKVIIEFLQWNDSNGCYTDENCDLEDVPRMAYDEAVKYFFGVVNEDAYNNISESMADIEYEKAIKYAKENNFYDATVEKLSALININQPTVEFYKSLI